MDPRTLVESVPCRSWKELFGQKKRWFTGGRAMDLKSILIFTLPYLFSLALLLSAIFAPGPAAWYALLIKLGVDFVFTLPAVYRFGRPGLLLVFPLYELYYYIYVLIFPPIVLAGREVIWKERSFKDTPRRTAPSQKSPRV
jgi:cellulose synthase/poly-beta-1,6-N-acetylglucosamine synthase-like glycosyltransferase